LVDAVVMLVDETVYEVYIVPRRMPIANEYPILSADVVKNLRA
jgi:hypothetical protein